ncbi:hypothetical protein ACKVWC_009604 [Pyricularia oryzae]
MKLLVRRFWSVFDYQALRTVSQDRSGVVVHKIQRLHASGARDERESAYQARRLSAAAQIDRPKHKLKYFLMDHASSCTHWASGSSLCGGHPVETGAGLSTCPIWCFTETGIK